MSAACREYDVLLSLHATNALRGEERARVEAHLASCETCREEVEATAEVLRLARLPAPAPAERRVLADLPERTVEAVRQGERRRGVVRRIALAMGAVAVSRSSALAARDAAARRPGVAELRETG
jgi:predicted anti-sigma-YlaC factor YlaD